MNKNVQFSDVIRARGEYNRKCETIFNMKYEQEWAYLENVMNTSIIQFLETASPENEGMLRWFSYERSRTPNLFDGRHVCKDYYEKLKNNGFGLKLVSHESMKNVIQIETRVSSSFPDREIIITVYY